MSFNIKATNVLWENANGDSSHGCCPHEEMLAVDRKKNRADQLGLQSKTGQKPKVIAFEKHNQTNKIAQ